MVLLSDKNNNILVSGAFCSGVYQYGSETVDLCRDINSF